LVGEVVFLIIIHLLGDQVDEITGNLDVLPFGPSEVLMFASFLNKFGWMDLEDMVGRKGIIIW
jgi:hypothetical protein